MRSVDGVSRNERLVNAAMGFKPAAVVKLPVERYTRYWEIAPTDGARQFRLIYPAANASATRLVGAEGIVQSVTMVIAEDFALSSVAPDVAVRTAVA